MHAVATPRSALPSASLGVILRGRAPVFPLTDTTSPARAPDRKSAPPFGVSPIIVIDATDGPATLETSPPAHAVFQRRASVANPCRKSRHQRSGRVAGQATLRNARRGSPPIAAMSESPRPTSLAPKARPGDPER